MQRHLCRFTNSTTKDEDTRDGEPYHIAGIQAGDERKNTAFSVE